MTTHAWVGPNGEDWEPNAVSDHCHRCGHTPDVHPQRVPNDLVEEARAIVHRIGGPSLAYHTRRRREKELAARLMALKAQWTR